jgi:hypothetical protein
VGANKGFCREVLRRRIDHRGCLHKCQVTVNTVLIIPVRDVARTNSQSITVPLRIRSRIVIQNRGVPSFLRGKENMGVLIKLVIGVWTKFEASKAILDDKRRKVTVRGTDVLLASNNFGLVIDKEAIMLKLSR